MMTLEIAIRHEPIQIFGKLQFEDWSIPLDDFTVKIDGKIAPPAMRDLILMGLQYQARLTDKTFMQVVDIYLKELGI